MDELINHQPSVSAHQSVVQQTPGKKKSFKILIIVSLVVLLLIVAFGIYYFFFSTPDTSDWNVYKNEKFGFEMRYPKDWAVDDDKYVIGAMHPFMLFLSPEAQLDFEEYEKKPPNDRGMFPPDVDISLAWYGVNDNYNLYTNVADITMTYSDRYIDRMGGEYWTIISGRSESAPTAPYDKALLEKYDTLFVLNKMRQGSNGKNDKVFREMISSFKFTEVNVNWEEVYEEYKYEEEIVEAGLDNEPGPSGKRKKRSTNSRSFRPEGGVLEVKLSDDPLMGVSVEIAEGILSSTTTISIISMTEYPKMEGCVVYEGFRLASDKEIEIDESNTPILLTVPFIHERIKTDDGLRLVFTYDIPSAKWGDSVVPLPSEDPDYFKTAIFNIDPLTAYYPVVCGPPE